MAIMLITHDLGVVAEIADEVAVMYLGEVVEQAPVDAIFHDPRHPYTRGLLRSIPRLESEVHARLDTIPGSVPHPYNRPQGCRFHPRCRERLAARLTICKQEAPALLPVGDDQQVRCWIYPRPAEQPAALEQPAAPPAAQAPPAPDEPRHAHAPIVDEPVLRAPVAEERGL